MISTSLRSLNLFCIVGYLAFMSLAIDSSMVDALVFYVNDQDGQPVFTTGQIQATPVSGARPDASALRALQFRRQPAADPRSTTGAPPAPAPTTRANADVAPSPGQASASLEDKGEEIALIEHAGVTDAFTAPAPSPQSRASTTEDDDDSDQEGEGDLPASLPMAPATPAAPPTPLRPRSALAAATAPSAPRVPLAATAATPNASPSTGAANRPLSPHAGASPSKATPGITTTTPASRLAALPAAARAAFSSPAPVAPPLPTAGRPLPASAQLPAAETGENPSILTLLKALPERPWTYHPGLDRYVVRYDADTLIVLTIRPSLQKLLEQMYTPYSCKLGAAIVQDPTTGAILAMTSFDGTQTLSPTDPAFKTDNWALQPTFPIASLFKIITAAAGIEKRQVSPNSSIKLGKKWRMTLWEAFAKSHNGVFGIVGRSVGQHALQAYANAFGFNQPFFFDLPVEPSRAELPASAVKLGEAAAGLNRTFEISPIHAASIVSTILNRGRQMKPYLVDYVMKGNRVIFRRKPFPVAQPLSARAAQEIYEMMKTTTTHGTGKRGFSGYHECPELATMCGGKTGTLTGTNPHLLFTWFGGFTRAAGRDLSIVFLVGQPGFTKLRAATLAGRFAYELLNGNGFAPATRVAAAH